MRDHVFRAYDIRGIVGTELLVEQVFDLARAIAFYCSEKNPSVKAVAVGMDGRLHSESIKDELIRGLQSSGLEIYFLGHCTTPMLYFSQYQLQVQMGIMITASHNPREYNGFKIVVNKEPVADQELQVVKKYFQQGKFLIPEKKGTIQEVSLVEQYCQFLKEQFSGLVGADFSLVFDCSNAVAGIVIPHLIKLFEWKNVRVIHQTLDGMFAHHEPDPTNQEALHDLKKAVIHANAQLGIGFDGDADRMGLVDQNGQYIPGDKIIALFAKSVLEKHPGASVICDSKCSDALPELITGWGGAVHIARTGHVFIKTLLKQTNALLAGELSCHYFFNDRYFGFDDGIYAALRLLEIIHSSQRSLTELLDFFPHRIACPELRITCPLQAGPEIVKVAHNYFKTQTALQMSTFDGVRIQTDYGWGLLRSSNTQSVICLRLEAHSDEGLERLKELFMQALLPSYSREFLEETLTW